MFHLHLEISVLLTLNAQWILNSTLLEPWSDTAENDADMHIPSTADIIRRPHTVAGKRHAVNL